MASRPQRPDDPVVDARDKPELADLASLFPDLLMAAMAAHHLSDPAIQGGEHIFLRRACWEAALVAYGRCFHQGRGPSRRSRRTLEDLVETLPADLQLVHSRLLTLRNKEIGHSVAGSSSQVVSLYRIVERNEIGVAVASTLYDRHLLENLQRITQTLRGLVGARIDALRLHDS